MIRRGKIPLANERKVNVRAQGSIAFPPRCPGESHLKTNVCEKQLLCPLLLSSLLLLFPPAPLKLSFSFLLSRRLRLTPSVAALSPASHLPRLRVFKPRLSPVWAIESCWELFGSPSGILSLPVSSLHSATFALQILTRGCHGWWRRGGCLEGEGGRWDWGVAFRTVLLKPAGKPQNRLQRFL